MTAAQAFSLQVGSGDVRSGTHF